MGKKPNGNKLPPFVPLTWDVLNSKAYIELPPSAAKALPYFWGKVKKGFSDPEKYVTQFTFSYPEGLRLGFSHTTFAKIIRDLEKFGFIDWVAQGGLRGKGKGYNRFKLTQRWENYKLQEPGKFVKPMFFKAKKDRTTIINECMAAHREELAKRNMNLEEEPVVNFEEGFAIGGKAIEL
jgi:hypothetical protein